MRRLLDDQDRETALGTIGSSLIAMALLLGSGLAASCTLSSPPASSSDETNQRIRNHSDTFFEKVDQEERHRAEEQHRAKDDNPQP